MDYIYGKLNYEVKKVEYVGLETSTTQTTVDNETRTVSVDVLKIPHVGLETSTTQTTVDNTDRTIEVDVLKVPHVLTILDKNDETATTFDGGEDKSITLHSYNLIESDKETLPYGSFAEYTFLKDDEQEGSTVKIPNVLNTDFTIKSATEAVAPGDAFASQLLKLQNSVFTVFTPTPATYSVSSSVLTKNMQTLFFSADGLKVFVIDTSTDIIYQYRLSTAWAVDTINSIAEAQFAITPAVEGTANGMFIRPDGTQLFFIGSGNKKLYSLTLVTPWSLIGATIVMSSSPILQNKALTALFISDDGTKVYIGNSTDDAINIFSLATPWDVTSTLTSLGSISVRAQETTPIGLYIGDNGTKLYVVGSDSDKVHQYTMNTPWGTSVAYTGKTVATQQNITTCVNFRPDGKRMFLIGTTTRKIDAYVLDTAWDIAGGDPIESTINEKFYFRTIAEANKANGKLELGYQLNNGAVTSLVTIDKDGRIETPNNVLKTRLNKIDNDGYRDLLIESNGAYFNLGTDGDTYINASYAGISLTAGTGIDINSKLKIKASVADNLGSEGLDGQALIKQNNKVVWSDIDGGIW